MNWKNWKNWFIGLAVHTGVIFGAIFVIDVVSVILTDDTLWFGHPERAAGMSIAFILGAVSHGTILPIIDRRWPYKS